MDFSVGLPKSTTQNDSIVVDEKTCGIWDLVKLGNQGGVLPLNGQYSISVTKTNQKWCNVQLVQYAVGKIKTSQQFFAIKRVEDKDKQRELKDNLRASEDKNNKLSFRIRELEMKLSAYNTDTSSSVKEKVVEL